MDLIDRQILELLQKDAKLTSKEIAGHIGLSVTPTYERIKRLEQQGIIERYSAILNKEKLEKGLVIFCNVQLKEHSKTFIDGFEKAVLELEEVMECYHIAGMFDYLLKVVTKDMASYQVFITKKLTTIENISNVQSSFVMTEVKHEIAYKLV